MAFLRSWLASATVKKVEEVAHFEGPLKGIPIDPSLRKRSVKSFTDSDSEFVKYAYGTNVSIHLLLSYTM